MGDFPATGRVVLAFYQVVALTIGCLNDYPGTCQLLGGYPAPRREATTTYHPMTQESPCAVSPLSWRD